MSDLIWVVVKRMTPIEKKCLPCPKLNKIKFSFADIAISRERSGDSGFEFGTVMCDQTFLEKPRRSRRFFLSWPVTEKARGRGRGREGWGFRVGTSPAAAAGGLILSSSASPLGVREDGGKRTVGLAL